MWVYICQQLLGGTTGGAHPSRKLPRSGGSIGGAPNQLQPPLQVSYHMYVTQSAHILTSKSKMLCLMSWSSLHQFFIRVNKLAIIHVDRDFQKMPTLKKWRQNRSVLEPFLITMPLWRVGPFFPFGIIFIDYEMAPGWSRFGCLS